MNFARGVVIAFLIEAESVILIALIWHWFD